MPEKKTDALTAKKMAEAIGTTPRELRMFLRASDDYEAVGSGGRHLFADNDVPLMKTRFDTWRKAQAEAKAAAAAARAKAAAAKLAAAAVDPEEIDDPDEDPGDDDAGDSTDTEAFEDAEAATKPARRTRKPA